MTLLFIALAIGFLWLLCGFIAWGFFFASISVPPKYGDSFSGMGDAALAAFVYGPIALWIALSDFSDDGWRLW